MRTYEQHIHHWQAMIELHTMQLQRCYPSEESHCRALRDAAAEAQQAIEKYKALCESAAPASGDGSEWFDNTSKR